MTSRQLIPIDGDLIESIAFKYGLPVERSADEQRVYVVCEDIVFYAPSLDAPGAVA